MVNITALNKPRFSEQIRLKVGEDYFSRSSRSTAERRENVTLVIRNYVVGRRPCLLQGICDSLVNLRLPLWGAEFAAVVSGHSSTITSSDECLCKRLPRHPYATPTTTTSTTVEQTPNATSIATLTTSNADFISSCPYGDRPFTSPIDLAAPKNTLRTHLTCRHFPSTFSYHMDLLGHMRLHAMLW
ncbi:unnamed protein product [Schistocephalus solidus]|uniref:Uncharacterized protein n=1 Tax=Schistocephalus solidus TaxID=70667 RepID=A0A183TEA2_SCHSO|nr:unnamed protein product [Schistocephalus solidus]